MRILVTGSQGLVGRAAIRVGTTKGHEVHSFSRKELDIEKREEIERAITSIKPDLILNCAAYTDVDGAEGDRESCFGVNAEAVAELARQSALNEILFATISTDYVFDGSNPGFYTEDSETRPLGVYGQSKVAGEQLALHVNPASLVIRTGWIFGFSGTNFLCRVPDFIRNEDDFFAIADSFGTPTFADDLVERMLLLSEMRCSGIYHVSNEGSGTSYLGFAQECAELVGVGDKPIKAVKADSLNRAARRPVSSKLTSVRLRELELPPLRNWKAALGEFVNKKPTPS